MTQVIEIDDPAELQGVIDAIWLGIQQAWDAIDYVFVLTDAIEWMKTEHKGFFDNEVDATGEAWRPLRPSTIAKKGHDTILFETGALRDSLTTGTSDTREDVITDEGFAQLIFGTMDEKAAFHQFGTSRMPARPPVGVTEKLIDRVVDATADTAVEFLKG